MLSPVPSSSQQSSSRSHPHFTGGRGRGVGLARIPQGPGSVGFVPGPGSHSEPPPTAQSSWTQLATEAPALPHGKQQVRPLELASGKPPRRRLQPPSPAPRQHQSSRWPRAQTAGSHSLSRPAGQWSSWPESGSAGGHVRDTFLVQQLLQLLQEGLPVRAGQGERPPRPSRRARSPPRRPQPPTAQSDRRAACWPCCVPGPGTAPRARVKGEGHTPAGKMESLTPMSGPVRDQ